ncbi:mechanosensitive ion channel family protein [Virgibacillus sp. NKC19-3]|uniref:mechanosensitive ion channel family protein n=1 Tax=Virgibacillus saliphilus TaxID=2831674 RepID=UPI001C9BA131|nr:mechanosensitive ion channel family protein [Virgibacillus sp. NKC19-3]MBY7144550.1 mechanosensitive ion channel family protein [Virgibacillus sp. NKC19-3]
MNWLSDNFYVLFDYITSATLWVWIGKTALRIAVIIIFAFVLKNVGKKVINAIFKERRNMPVKLSTNRREQTLKNLLNSVLSYGIMFIAIMMILDTFNVPIKTMLAGAGVAGLAIGFGAQSLVRDVIGGFFIIFEDQFSVGDYIEIGAIEGDVVAIGLRVTQLRSYYGQTYVIPNGNIDIVTNYSATNGFAMVEVNVPYESNIIQIENMIEETLQSLPEKYDMFVGTPVINGVQALELSNYVLRIRAETVPVMQWAGARAIRKEVKEDLFEQGISIPSPRMVVYPHDEQEPRLADR